MPADETGAALPGATGKGNHAMSAAEPQESNDFLVGHATRLLESHLRLTGRALLPEGPAAEVARALYHAPFVVLSHDTGDDPLFTYANLAAQERFELPWAEIVGMPSRFSAEPLARHERQRLLERVARDGYIDDYSGVRIAKSGRRFMIRRATVWNLVDADGNRAGQAATFSDWQAL
jgi:MEKHLA domain